MECGEYATAEVILKMEHLKMHPASKFAAKCIRQCAERAEGTTRKESLLYLPSIVQAAKDSKPSETTVWHSIYDDPAVRKYSPRYIPDYVEICRQLKEGGDLSNDTVQSLVLQSVGPLLSLIHI